MVRTSKEVFEVLQGHHKNLRALGVRRLQLFGSAARGEANHNSDLDFLVELQPKSFDTYMDVKFMLEDLFSCKVDLVLADHVKTALRQRIFEEAVDAPGF